MPSATMRSSTRKILTLTLCAMFAALTAVGAFIKIPIPHLPITLQTFFVMMSGLLLGGTLGAASVAAYVAIGLIGIPVFTEGGGIGYVYKPSFGYLAAFILGAFIAGKIANAVSDPSFVRILAACLVSTAVVYIIGMGYFFLAMNTWVGKGITVSKLFALCFVPVFGGDILKCLLAAFLGKRLIPLTARYRQG